MLLGGVAFAKGDIDFVRGMPIAGCEGQKYTEGPVKNDESAHVA